MRLKPEKMGLKSWHKTCHTNVYKISKIPPDGAFI